MPLEPPEPRSASIQVRIPNKLRIRLQEAAAARFQKESEFARQAILEKLERTSATEAATAGDPDA